MDSKGQKVTYRSAHFFGNIMTILTALYLTLLAAASQARRYNPSRLPDNVEDFLTEKRFRELHEMDDHEPLQTCHNDPHDAECPYGYDCQCICEDDKPSAAPKDSPTDPPTDPLTDQLTDQPTDQLINQSIKS